MTYIPGGSAYNEVIAAGHTEFQRATHESAGTPTADNDSADTAGLGKLFIVGNTWFDNILDVYYVLQDDTAGAAVWAIITTGSWHAGEAITTENITGTDTALADTLDNTPSGPIILVYQGVVMKAGAGEDYTISGSTITWLADTGTAPNMVLGETLEAYYGSTGLSQGSAAAQNVDHFSLAGARFPAGHIPLVTPSGGSAPICLLNFTREAVEAYIDSSTPIPDVSGNGNTFVMGSGSAIVGRLRDTTGLYFDGVSYGIVQGTADLRTVGAFTVYFRGLHYHGVPGTNDNIYSCYAIGSSLGTNHLWGLRADRSDIDKMASLVEYGAGIEVLTTLDVQSMIVEGLYTHVRESDGVTNSLYLDNVLLASWVSAHVAEGNPNPVYGSQLVLFGNSGNRIILGDWAFYGEVHNQAQRQELMDAVYAP